MGLRRSNLMSEDDKNDEEENNGRSPGVITSDDVECPSCHRHFSSPSAYNNHLPCAK